MTTGPRWPEVSRHLRGRAVARVSRFGTWEPTAAVFLLVICLLLPPIAGAQVKVVRRVLILNELGAASPAINLIDGEIRDRLERSPYQIELYVESLETTLFPDPATQKEFLESYIHKYRDRKPDVIFAYGGDVAGNSAVLDGASEYRAQEPMRMSDRARRDDGSQFRMPLL